MGLTTHGRQEHMENMSNQTLNQTSTISKDIIPSGCIYLLDENTHAYEYKNEHRVKEDIPYKVMTSTGEIKDLTLEQIKDAYGLSNICNAVFIDYALYRLDGKYGYSTEYILDNFQAYRKALTLGATTVIDFERKSMELCESAVNLCRITEFNNELYSDISGVDTLEFLCKNVNGKLNSSYNKSWHKVSAKTVIIRYPEFLENVIDKLSIHCDVLIIDGLTKANSFKAFKSYMNLLVQSSLRIRQECKANFMLSRMGAADRLGHIQSGRSVGSLIEYYADGTKKLHGNWLFSISFDIWRISGQCMALYELGNNCEDVRQQCLEELIKCRESLKNAGWIYNNNINSVVNASEAACFTRDLSDITERCQKYIRDLGD